MSALDDLLKVVHDESFSQDMYDLGELATAELLALRSDFEGAKARAKQAEENWHKNEARLGKLRIVADALAEIVEYDTGDARHGLQSLAKARLAEYEKLKGAE